MNNISDWWDDSEFDHFKSLPKQEKLSYLYDLYADDDLHVNIPDVDKQPFEDDEDGIDDDFSDSPLFKPDLELSDDIPKTFVSIIESVDDLSIVGSDELIINSLVKRMFMNGVILSLIESKEIDGGFRKTYKIVGMAHSIGVN